MHDATTAAIDLLRSLVAFDTTSSLSNLPLIEFVRDYLTRHGVSSRILPDSTGAKASLIATIGPNVAGGVVLSGHTDVVPVAGQHWNSDPFTLTVGSERLTGRGVADMKGFIAGLLAMVPHLRADALARPAHLALSFDEEVGCTAAPALLAALEQDIAPPAVVVVGEPTEMQVARRHRGIEVFETEVRGRAAHSGLNADGVNAIALAARCILRLEEITRTLSMGPPGVDSTSVNIGRIEGGTAVNIVASGCRFLWECRPAAGETADAVLARFEAFVNAEVYPALRARAPEVSVETFERFKLPGLCTPAASEAVSLATRWCGDDRVGDAQFASEAGFFSDRGWPTVVCGPGSVRQAHQPNEWLAIEQLDGCVAFLHRLSPWLRSTTDR